MITTQGITIKCYIMNKINEIIRETIENFINEELSISDDVERYCDDIYRQIMELNRNNSYRFHEYRYLQKEGENGNVIHIPYTVKVFYAKSTLYNNIEVPCKITVLDFESYDLMVKYVTQVEEWGDNKFNVDMLDISFTVNGFDGRIDISSLNSSLHHEAEHAYQLLRSDKTKLMTSKTKYYKAISVSDAKIDSNDIDMKKRFNMVADLIYYYHHAELDAKVNGLYSELKLGIPYTDTQFKMANDNMINVFHEVLDTYSPKHYDEVMTYFGIDFNSFVKFIYRQQKYLLKKAGKVVMKVKKHNTEIKESIKVEKLHKTPLHLFIR